MCVCVCVHLYISIHPYLNRFPKPKTPKVMPARGRRSYDTYICISG